MPWIEFIAPPKGPYRGETYKPGDIVEVTDDVRDRWLRRGLAKVVDAPKGKTHAKAVAAEEKAPETESEEPEVIEIPKDWRDAHHATKRKLARDLAGIEPDDTEHAEELIAAEAAKRNA